MASNIFRVDLYSDVGILRKECLLQNYSYTLIIGRRNCS